MIIGPKVKLVCDQCGLETHADMVLMVSGQMGPRLPDKWQLVAPGTPDGKPTMGPIAAFCPLHHRKPRLVEPIRLVKEA